METATFKRNGPLLVVEIHEGKIALKLLVSKCTLGMMGGQFGWDIPRIRTLSC